MSPYRQPATREQDTEDRELDFAVRLAAAFRFLMLSADMILALHNRIRDLEKKR